MSNTTKVLLEHRPATLIGRFTETMPDADIRPIRDNAAVREEAASNVYPLVQAAWPGVDPVRLREAFIAVVKYDTDPKVVAAKMSAKLKAQPGAGFADAMAQFSHEIDICHALMIQSWVKAHNIRPLYSEGAKVVATIREGYFASRTYAGKITEIDLDMAQYTVMCKEEGKAKFLIVPYENVAGREEPTSEKTNPIALLIQDSE